MKFKPGDKVKFINSYNGVFHKLKDKIMTVMWHHTEFESGKPGGTVKIEELRNVKYHSINPHDLELVK